MRDSAPGSSASGGNLGFLRTKVIEVELSRPIETVQGLHGYVFALILARDEGEPLGTVRVPVHGDEVPAAALVEAIAGELGPALLRRRLVAMLEAPPETRRLDIEAVINGRARSDIGTGRALPTLTAAVCTRDRPQQLSRCLGSLRRLRGDIRVLVVDNAPSTDGTARLVATDFPEFDYVVEPRAGLDHARNRAIAEAATDVIAFTDDDAVVDERWASAIVGAFGEEPGLAAVTGLVLPLELETPAQELFERLGGFGRGFRRRWETASVTCGIPRSGGTILGAGEFGTGANMAFRRSVFERVGGFDPALDVGTPTRGGGDLEMFHRVLACGECLRYEPSAIVFHQHRRTPEELRSQLYGNGGQWAMMTAALRGHRTTVRDMAKIARWYAIHRWPHQVLSSLMVPNRVPIRFPLAEIEGNLAAAFGRWYGRSRSINPEDAVPPIPRGCAAAARTEVAGAIGVMTVDVADAQLDGVGAYDGPRCVLVTRGTAAVGRVDVDPSGHRIAGRQLRERIVDELGVRLLRECVGRPAGEVRDEVLGRIAAELRGVAAPAPSPRTHAVSIVIATLDRPDSLLECLDSLRRQRSRHDVEIVVVDNNPGSGLTSAVLAERPDVIHVTESRRGSAYARNAGFVAATGDILVTIDDDVQVMPGWLDLLLVPFDRNDVMAVSGNIQPAELRTAAQREFEELGGLGKGFERRESRWQNPRGAWRPFAAWELGATANAAFRADVISHPEIGLMDEALGAGMPSGVGEDSYLFYRIVRAGYTVVYEPAALVLHRHREDSEELSRQLMAYYSGHVAHNLTTLVRDGDLRAIGRLAKFAVVETFVPYARNQISRRRETGVAARAQRRGVARGPANYVRSQRLVRQLGRSGPGETERGTTRRGAP